MSDQRNWFDVDRDGLKKILEGRGKAWAIFELIQNCWDLDGAKTVKVTLEAIAGSAQAWLTVEDDDPDGFKDLTHAFTLFAESEKKSDPTKRGRFNLGCKLVLALCYEAAIVSTTGTVQFHEGGRFEFGGVKYRRENGSVFRGRLAMTRAELADVEDQIYRLLPPPNVVTFVRIHNGTRWTEAELTTRDPEAVFEATLLTEISNEEGFLQRRDRKTTIHLYSADNAMLFEMGLPVQPIEGPWSANVLQKVPLNLDRTAVPSTFVSKLQTLVANHTARDLMAVEFTKPWIAEVVQDKNVSPEIVKLYLNEKYGDKFVIDVPGSEGQESGREAVANGYTVIRGGAEAGATWTKIKEHGLAQKATALFPPPSHSSNWKAIPEEQLDVVWQRLGMYARELAERLLNDPSSATVLTVPRVRFIESPTLTTLATWRRSEAGYSEGPELTFNVTLLGEHFFKDGPTVEVNQLLLHELAHNVEGGDHLTEIFDDEMARLGAKLAELALKDARFFIDYCSPAYIARLLEDK